MDKDLRQAERINAACSTPATQARVLIGEHRRGEISWEMLCLRAFLGEEAARLATNTTTHCVAGGHSEPCITEWGDLCPWMYAWADARDYARGLLWLAEASGFDPQRTATRLYRYILYAALQTKPWMLDDLQVEAIENRIQLTDWWLDGKHKHTYRGARPDHHPMETVILPPWANIGTITWTPSGWENHFPDLIETMALVVGQQVIKDLLSLEMVSEILPEKGAA